MKNFSKNLFFHVNSIFKNFWTIFEEYDELKTKVQKTSVDSWKDFMIPTKKSSGVLAFFPYKEAVVKKAIILIKEHEEKEIAKKMIGAITDDLIAEIAEENELYGFGEPLVVPIPLFDKKILKKGFNHSEVFAREISNLLNAEFAPKVLKKIKETKDQHGLSKEEREKNLKNAFKADPEKISGKNILLIDDVTTTGVTLLEAEKELFAKKARRVLKIAIAY